MPHWWTVNTYRPLASMPQGKDRGDHPESILVSGATTNDGQIGEMFSMVCFVNLFAFIWGEAVRLEGRQEGMGR